MPDGFSYRCRLSPPLFQLIREIRCRNCRLTKAYRCPPLVRRPASRASHTHPHSRSRLSCFDTRCSQANEFVLVQQGPEPMETTSTPSWTSDWRNLRQTPCSRYRFHVRSPTQKAYLIWKQIRLYAKGSGLGKLEGVRARCPTRTGSRRAAVGPWVRDCRSHWDISHNHDPFVV